MVTSLRINFQPPMTAPGRQLSIICGRGMSAWSQKQTFDWWRLNGLIADIRCLQWNTTSTALRFVLLDSRSLKFRP